MLKKIFLTIFVSLVICVSLFSFVGAMTESEKQTLINQIVAQIAILQEELNRKLAEQGTSVTNSSTSTQWCHTFNVSMKYGDSGVEVSALQKALQLQGLLSANSNEIPGGFFGASTLTAVISFQEKYRSEILTPTGLTKGTGSVASYTRAKLNKLYGCNVITNNPIASLTPSNQICNPNWQCTSWGLCSMSGYQTRTCVDYNQCNSSYFRKTESQLCSTISTVYPNNNSSTSLSSGSSSSSSSSSFGSVIGCSSDWVCGNWGICSNGQQTRECLDYAVCNSSNYRRTESQYCSGTTARQSCVTDIECTEWSSCINGQQTQSCLDFNQCNFTLNNETEYTRSCSSSSTSGSSGSSTGSSSGSSTSNICSSRWICDDWTRCDSTKIQARTCYDANRCAVPTNVQETSRSCVCEELWEVGDWSSCDNSTKTKTRNVFDISNCGTTVNKPVESEECCDSIWECNWGECNNDVRYANCIDLNSCPMPNNMPETVQPCISSRIDIKINNSDGPLSVPVNSNLPLNITWSSNDNSVYNCSASGDWSGTKDNRGSIYVSSFSGPLTVGSYFYRIQCRSSSGYIEDSVTVNVIEPIVIIKANDIIRSTEIYSGNSVVVSWSATNAKANSCTFSGDWTGTGKPVSGSQVVGPLTSSKKYTVTCYDESNNSRSASVNVNVKKLVDIKENGSDGPVNKNVGGYASLTWSIDDSLFNCRATDDYFLLSGTGYQSPRFTEPKVYNYTISCLNSYGQTISDTVVVNVVSITY